MKTLIALSEKIFDVDGLLHDASKTDVIEDNMCEYNFNRSIDALCFKNALSRFIRTGTKEDAFEVFFCYFETFKTFGGYRNGIDKLLKLLYDHESNAATLLKKHRDHYSHSVYVFALGLAVYMNNKNMRDAFASLYGRESAEYKFLKAWGMAALFHDIGYPYEISFMQVNQYGDKIDGGKGSARLTMNYSDLTEFIKLSPNEVCKCGDFMPSGKSDMHALFIDQIIEKFGTVSGNVKFERKMLSDCMTTRITNATEYIDHGYFSAVLLLRELFKTPDFKLDQMTLDAVTAILLHNSLYKRTYKSEIAKDKYKQMSVSVHPLAWLLMLCDELQCWDRAAYGESSRKQELAWDMDICVSNKEISATYYFENGAPEDIKKITELVADITQNVVNCSEIVDKFTADSAIKKKSKKVYAHLSDSRFINLCRMAESINDSYNEDMSCCSNEEKRLAMTEKFDKLTLEYKLSNIEQAKGYIKHIGSVGCFFSDKQLDYVPVESFTDEEIEYLAKNEHIRWVNEKVSMGWKYGKPKDKRDRENSRMHPDIIPYEYLAQIEQQKDRRPMRRMIANFAVYGIHIYRISAKKEPYALGCTGHIDLSRIKGFDEEAVRTAIRSYIREFSDKYALKLYCGFADGADLLFAEEALKCGVEVVAVLPCEWDEFIAEHADGGVKYMQLLGQVSSVIVKRDNVNRYAAGGKYIVENSNEIIALWDGKELALIDKSGKAINRGGTYNTLLAAQSAGKKIVQF